MRDKMKTVYKGKIITLKLKNVKFSDGHISLYECVLHKPAVAIVPVIDNNKILLIKQLRPVINKRIWELPAGLVDKNEKPADAAKRELEEETGFKPQKLVKLGEMYSSPGFTDEKTTLFLAKDFIKTEQKLDKDEEIEIAIFSFDVLLNKIKRNQLKDAKTMLGILLAIDYIKSTK